MKIIVDKLKEDAINVYSYLSNPQYRFQQHIGEFKGVTQELSSSIQIYIGNIKLLIKYITKLNDGNDSEKLLKSYIDNNLLNYLNNISDKLTTLTKIYDQSGIKYDVPKTLDTRLQGSLTKMMQSIVNFTYKCRTTYEELFQSFKDFKDVLY